MAGSPTEMAIFQRVVERGSFAGAADDVGLSPSAVAKLITRLEGRLGVRLINRTTRRLALTAEGEIYLERSRDILRAIESAEAEIASEIYSTAGDYDLLVKFYVDKDTDIGHFVNEKVQVIPGIQDTHTIITFKAFGAG